MNTYWGMNTIHIFSILSFDSTLWVLMQTVYNSSILNCDLNLERELHPTDSSNSPHSRAKQAPKVNIRFSICNPMLSSNLFHSFFFPSAAYTGIKKPESFSHLGFSLKVARQLPLNTPKNPNRKTHLPSEIFWNSAKISLVFCQCKRSLPSRRYYSGFWSRGTWPSAESPDRGPRRNAHYTCTVKGREKSRMRTTYQNTSMRFGFFRACAFRAKNPECYGFFWQCKRYNKKPRFLGFWFLPM